MCEELHPEDPMGPASEAAAYEDWICLNSCWPVTRVRDLREQFWTDAQRRVC